MLRQNRSEGSSTSRSFRQAYRVTGSPEDLPIQRRTMSPVHFHDGTTFPHSLCSGRGPGVRPPPEVPYFFRRNHFPSCRPAEPVRLEATWEIGFARLTAALFSREPLFLVPSG